VPWEDAPASGHDRPPGNIASLDPRGEEGHEGPSEETGPATNRRRDPPVGREVCAREQLGLSPDSRGDQEARRSRPLEVDGEADSEDRGIGALSQARQRLRRFEMEAKPGAVAVRFPYSEGVVVV